MTRSQFASVTTGTRHWQFRFTAMTQSTLKQVLVVEDHPLIRIGATDVLRESGFTACEAGNAEEALETLAQNPEIGLLFTDLIMPGQMDGLDLARHVHEALPDVELIVTSGAAMIDEDVIPDHGSFLAKPYSADRLVELVVEKLCPAE
jgi:CheY-like chemotaxis protein